MRLSVDTTNGEHRKKISDFVRKIFPNITVSSPEIVIEKNKPGIVVLDRKSFLKYQELIQKVRERDGRLNFSVVIAGESDHLHGVDASIDPENLSLDTVKMIRKLVMEKMRETTVEKLKNRVRDMLAIHEKLGLATIITDKKGKIVYINETLKQLLGDKTDETEIINTHAPDFLEKFLKDHAEIKGLFSRDARRVEFSTTTTSGREVSVFGAPIRSMENETDGYIIIIRDISEDSALRRLWNIYVELVSDFSPQKSIRGDSVRFLTEILKKFASALGLKNLVFVPIYTRYTGKPADEIPVLIVKRMNDGTYRLHIKYGLELSEEDKRKCLNPDCAMDSLLSLRGGASRSHIKSRKYTRKLALGDLVVGILCFEREAEFSPQEIIFIEWFENEIINRTINTILDNRLKNVDILEKTLGTNDRIGIVVLDRDGRLIQFNDGFLKIFNIPLEERERLENGHIENLRPLNKKRRVIDRIRKVLTLDKPKHIKKWIAVGSDLNNYRYLHIHIYPLESEVSGDSFLVGIFEDRTEERLHDSRSKFVHDIIVQKTKIYEEISRSMDQEGLDQFIRKTSETVCKRLGEVLDGVVFAIGSPPEHSVISVCPKVQRVLDERKAEELLNFIIRKREREGITRFVCNVNLDSFEGPFREELRRAGYRFMVVVPVKSPAESGILGHMILFARYDPNNLDRVMIFSRIPAVCNVDRIHREEVDIFLQFANIIGDYLSIFQRKIETRKNQEYLNQIFENVEDAILIVNREGLIERSNSRVLDIFGVRREEVVGKFLKDFLSGTDSELIDRSLKSAFSEGSSELYITYRMPERYFTFDYEEERQRHIRLKFQFIRLLGEERVMIVAEDVTDLTTFHDTLQDMTSGLLWTMLNLLGGKSATLKIHSANVAYIVDKISVIAYPDKFEKYKGRGCLVLGAILHDIGKIRVPSSILVKPMDRIARDILDYEIYKKHVVYGKEMMENIPLPCGGKIPVWIYQHHEAMDGSGFPEGLKGDEISFGSRVIAAANYFENEIIVKPFKKQKTPGEVIRTMRGTGKFDPDVVNALQELVEKGEIVSGPGGKLVSTEREADTLIQEIVENFKNLYERKNLEKH